MHLLAPRFVLVTISYKVSLIQYGQIKHNSQISTCSTMEPFLFLTTENFLLRLICMLHLTLLYILIYIVTFQLCNFSYLGFRLITISVKVPSTGEVRVQIKQISQVSSCGQTRHFYFRWLKIFFFVHVH